MDVLLHRIFEQVDHVSVISNGERFAAFHGIVRPFERFAGMGCDALHPSLRVARFDTRIINFSYDRCGTGNVGGFRLCAAHAAQSGRDEEMSAQVTVLRYAQLHASGVKQGVERAVHNPLRTNVHPSAGRHLTVVGDTHLCGDLPVGEVIELSDHHRVGYDHARCVGLGAE